MINRLITLITNALGKPRQSETPSLPIEVQNYLDSRIRDAVDRINDQTEHRMRELVKEKFRFWEKFQNWLGVIGILFGLFSILGMREFLRNRAEKAAMDYLTTNVVHNAMTETFRSNVTAFTHTQLEPLQQQIRALSNGVVAMRQDLAKEQLSLQTRIRLQEDYLGARIGSLSDYHDLQSLCESNSEIAFLATGAREEVDRFFESYAHSPEKKILIDAVSSKPYAASVEELIDLLSNANAGNRIAAATALKELHMSNTVQSICKHLKIETNLFVITHLVEAVRPFMDAPVGTLDSKGVLDWWTKYQTNQAFQAPYEDFIAVAHPTTGQPLRQNSVNLLAAANALIAREPNACEARFYRARTLLNGRNLSAAEQEIAEIEKRLPNHHWVYSLRAELHFRKGEVPETIAALNKLFEASASQANFLATNQDFYGTLLKDSRLKWPPQVKRIN